MAKETYHYYVQAAPQRRPYGCFSFLLDVFLFMATGGLWAFWIIWRELRRR